MSKKIITVGIVGCGARGCDAYGYMFNRDAEKYKIVTLCDVNQAKLDKYGKEFNVPQEARFVNEEEFFAKRRADLLVVATLDKLHVRQTVKALELGYDILLEKPISDDIDECNQLLEAQKKYGGKVFVCHVLRYSKAFTKVKELLDSGVIGRLVMIDVLEQITYWHIAHSYVRGNWRRSEETTPLILAKSCHDLDLIQYYANAKCKSLTSVGDLSYFTKENAPKGCADRCVNCSVKDCPYDARKIYIDWWKSLGSPKDRWPFNVLTIERPLTEEILSQAITNGSYGRCVFHCDNNVVDHQIVQMTFENGVKACLRTTGFTKDSGRLMTFFGTLGEIDFTEDVITLKFFGKEPQIIDVRVTGDDEMGYTHGGGDLLMINDMYNFIMGTKSASTLLEASIESHLMGIAAEESRKNGGKLVYIHK